MATMYRKEEQTLADGLQLGLLNVSTRELVNGVGRKLWIDGSSETIRQVGGFWFAKMREVVLQR